MRTATVKWVGGEEYLATMPSGQAVVIDADREHNSAPGPMDILLGALGACSSVDVVSILAKKRHKLVITRNSDFRRARQRPAVGLDENRHGLQAHRRTRRKSRARRHRIEPNQILFGCGNAAKNRGDHLSLSKSSAARASFRRATPCDFAPVFACHCLRAIAYNHGLFLRLAFPSSWGK